MGKFITTGNYVYKNCQYCGHETTATNISKHKTHCYLNPDNIKLCPVCHDPIKNYKTNTTCSRSCANRYFRTGSNNPNFNWNNYRSVCFLTHDKKCIICGEHLIVEVHHYDNNHENNYPTNLVPLCSTHHKYMHSKHKHIISDQVDAYVKDFTDRYETTLNIVRTNQRRAKS